MKILETFSGLNYELTEEQADNIMHQSVQGSSKGCQIGTDYISFASIKSISSPLDYHQPYTPVEKGVGFNGVIGRETKRSALVALSRGLKAAKSKLEVNGQTTANVDNILVNARLRYRKLNVDNYHSQTENPNNPAILPQNN